MWTCVSISEAVNTLIAGGRVDDGFYSWGGSIKLRQPARWRKARRRKQLARLLSRRHVGDGWWVYKT